MEIDENIYDWLILSDLISFSESHIKLNNGMVLLDQINT